MMKKALSLLLALLLLATSLCACKQEVSTPDPTDATAQGEKRPLPQPPEDYFAVLCGNLDVLLCDFIGYRGIDFMLISASPLDGETVNVQFDQDIPFTASVRMDEEPVYIDDVSFAAYQGISWENATTGDMSQMSRLRNEIPKEELPKLYTGKLTISFDDSLFGQELTLRQLSVTVRGKTHTYALENFGFSKLDFPVYAGAGLLVRTVAIMQKKIDVNASGSFEVPSVEIEAQEALTIDKIEFSNPAIRVAKVTYQKTLPDGQTIDTAWDGSAPLAMAAGDTLELTIIGESEKLQSALEGNLKQFLLFRYTCGGEACIADCELDYCMQLVPFQYYAQTVDGLDIAGYYAKFR